MTTHSVIQSFSHSLIPSSPHSVIQSFSHSVISKLHQGFTLIELLVVIGIIGVLTSVLLIGFGGGTESARAAKCLSNLHALAVAWNGGRAGSQEHIQISVDNGHVNTVYWEAKGWISSNTKGLYSQWDSDVGHFVSKSHQKFDPISLYTTDKDLSAYAITNGWIYGAIGRSRETFVCPTHANKFKGEVRPNWSYFMNAAAGWDAAQGGHSYNDKFNNGAIWKQGLTNADRLLLFAEIPFQGPGDWFPEGESGTIATDAILQYNGCDKAHAAVGSNCYNGNENIGGNHKSGRNWVAHVAFADGHVEKLNVTGLEGDALKELTTWLCQGKAVVREGKRYDELK